MQTLGTVLIALLVPLGWGLLSAWAFDRLRQRRPTKPVEETPQKEQPA